MSIAYGPKDGQTQDQVPSRALVFDLDGTLIATDLLAETLLLFLKVNPLRIFVALGWLLKGRAYLKRRLAEAVELDVELLPVREDVVAYARQQAAAGRPVYIATAADGALARKLALRFDFARAIIGSDGAVNLKSAHKAAALKERFPEGFAYVGDAAADLKVWASADAAIYAGGPGGLLRRLQRIKAPETVIPPPPRAGLRTWAKALRLHQWAKNSLIFVPIILGGKAHDLAAWTACLLGFLGMGVLASATYVLNDLFDLQEDRQHWTKKARAFASGKLPITAGLATIPIGLIGGMALGYAGAGLPAVGMLALYLVVTLSYSFGLKRAPILDVVILAGLFTLRLAFGVICAGVAWSAWLLVFSMFIFSSLSFAKRLTEIARLKARGGDKLSGRGYLAVDEPLVLALGTSLASAAVFVMVMYLIEEAFRAGFYKAPAFMWTFPVVLALWLGRIWLLCGRGQLDDDPVVFAVRDRISLGLGAFLALNLAAAILL
jgi:4-hydroxybenzoate polyprenyltransferase/phosphoglycolate phosphatase-like HAD superfamily hydrolase